MSGSSDVTRREVLGGLAAGVGVLAVPGWGVSSRRTDALRVGLFGYGGRGMQILKALGYYDERDPRASRGTAPLPRLESIEVTAVCDVFKPFARAARSAVEAVGGSATSYDAPRAMLDAETLDAVIITTADHNHAPLAIAAMEAGVDVYVEKCMANDVAQTLALRDARTRTGRVVQVGHQGRQDRMQAMAKAIIDRGDIGEVSLVQAFVSRGGPQSAWIREIARDGNDYSPLVNWPAFLGPAPQRPFDPERFFEWRRYWDYSTGPAGDLMSHDLDKVGWIMDLGIPSRVVASGGVHTWRDGRETPDTFSASFDHPDDDVTLTYACNLSNNYHKRATLFLGTEGTMELSWQIRVYADKDSARYADAIRDGKIEPSTPFIQIGVDDGTLVAETAPSSLWLQNQGLLSTVRDGEIVDTTRLHLEEFFEACRTRAQPSCGVDDAFAPTIATHMAVESYRSGRAIGWDAEHERTV